MPKPRVSWWARFLRWAESACMRDSRRWVREGGSDSVEVSREARRASSSSEEEEVMVVVSGMMVLGECAGSIFSDRETRYYYMFCLVAALSLIYVYCTVTFIPQPTLVYDTGESLGRYSHIP